ncbi:MAG: hypothetical protein ACREDR_19085 [Blastocatellia bacterium]
MGSRRRNKRRTKTESGPKREISDAIREVEMILGPPPANTVVKAHAFHLYCKAGTLRATLTADDDSHALCLSGPDGETRLAIITSETETSLNFCRDPGFLTPGPIARRLALGCLRVDGVDLPAISLNDEGGDTRALLAIGPDGAAALSFIRPQTISDISWQFHSDHGACRNPESTPLLASGQLMELWRGQRLLVYVKNGKAWLNRVTGAEVLRTLEPLAHILGDSASPTARSQAPK